MKILIPLCIVSLLGCASPRIVYSDNIYEHIDTVDDRPEWCERGPSSGCYAKIDGKDHIWYSAVSPSYIRKHEKAHAKGMVHGPWHENELTKYWCADVLIGTADYPQNTSICHDNKKEWIQS